MTRYFMKFTPLFAAEVQMMTPPRHQPRRSGRIRSSFRYSADDVRCKDCTRYDSGQPCHLNECVCLEERIEAGVVELNTLARECFGGRMFRPLQRRLRDELNRQPFRFFLGDAHRERWTHWKNRCYGMSERNAAALFLLTADEELWQRVLWHFDSSGFDFPAIRLSGIHPELYSIYQAAKTISVGGDNIVIEDLAFSELVSDRAFRLILGALLLCRYGEVVLNLERKTEEKPHECCLYRTGRRQHHTHGRTGGGEMSRLTMGSLFDGIGGFPLAAVRSGITPVWASEIEAFPIEVTKLRFPDMVHVGDITKLNGAELPPVDIICGGSPCQDLSVAGARAGLAGARSGLFMEQVRLVKEMRNADIQRGRTAFDVRPRFMAWENVPGAFSSGTPKGEDFRIVLEEIVRVKCDSVSVPRPDSGRWESAGRILLGADFSLAWRCLDAQYWGVAQRRKRIFLIADFAGRSAPKILFVPESLPGHPAPGL